MHNSATRFSSHRPSSRDLLTENFDAIRGEEPVQSRGEDYDMLLSIDPSNYEAFIMRKISVEALLDRGNFYLRKGDKNLAGEDFQNACRFGNDAGCAALKALGTDTHIRGNRAVGGIRRHACLR